jgi:hypothetical protein
MPNRGLRRDILAHAPHHPPAATVRTLKVELQRELDLTLIVLGIATGRDHPKGRRRNEVPFGILKIIRH